MTRRVLTVSDRIVVAASADAIWARLADPNQMGRWSPENTGAETPSPGRPLTVGDEFVGSNRRGRYAWRTRCRVVAADPGRRFAFRVERIGLGTPRLRAGIATWQYDLEPVDGGTEVTETWYDDRTRWPDPVASVFDRAVTGGRLFHEHQQGNIARTLARLKADLEG